MSFLNQYSVEQKLKFIEYFSEFISPNKLELYSKISQDRTRYITMVVENIYSEQNASAIIRSAECFGIQDVHVIEEYNKFKTPKKIASGASKWLHINRYSKEEKSIDSIVSGLRNDGYKIVCTSPHAPEITPYNIDLSQKMALFFGEEEPGLTQEIQKLADEHMLIPMCGFTESLNVSVSAGIVMSVLKHRLVQENVNWHLSFNEQTNLKLEWMLNSIKGGKEMLSRLI